MASAVRLTAAGMLAKRIVCFGALVTLAVVVFLSLGNVVSDRDVVPSRIPVQRRLADSVPGSSGPPANGLAAEGATAAVPAGGDSDEAAWERRPVFGGRGGAAAAPRSSKYSGPALPPFEDLCGEFRDDDPGTEIAMTRKEVEEFKETKATVKKLMQEQYGEVRVQPGELLKRRYVVRKRLGRGATAEVYAAFDLRARRHVALKVMRNSTLIENVFDREGSILRSLRTCVASPEGQAHAGHQHIAASLDDFRFTSLGGVTHKVTVQSLLVSYAECVYVDFVAHETTFKRAMRNMLQGLAFMHDTCNMLHGDLKPSVMFLDLYDPQRRRCLECMRRIRGDEVGRQAEHGCDSCDVIISDFGSVYEGGLDDHAKTHLHTFVALAPEVLTGGDYTAQADIWSVGVTAYMMMCQDVPFLPTDATEADIQHPLYPLKHVKEILRNEGEVLGTRAGSGGGGPRVHFPDEFLKWADAAKAKRFFRGSTGELYSPSTGDLLGHLGDEVVGVALEDGSGGGGGGGSDGGDTRFRAYMRRCVDDLYYEFKEGDVDDVTSEQPDADLLTSTKGAAADDEGDDSDGKPEDTEAAARRGDPHRNDLDDEGRLARLERAIQTADRVADFLRPMFHLDPARRPSAKELLRHPWLQT